MWFCHILLELSYTFDHIWTNLLTQCTSVPVFVFCYLSISGFPTIKSAPKIWEKSDKQSACRNLPESPCRGQRGPPGTQAPWWRALGLGRARGAPGPLVTPLAAYRSIFPGIFWALLMVEKPEIQKQQKTGTGNWLHWVNRLVQIGSKVYKSSSKTWQSHTKHAWSKQKL